MRGDVTVVLLAVLALTSCSRCGDAGGVDAGEDACVNCRTNPDAAPADVGFDLPNATCIVGPEGGFCETPFCRVTVEPDVFDRPTGIELSEGTPARSIANDVLGPRTCLLGELGVEPSGPFSLAVRYVEDEIPAGYAEGELVGAWIAGGFESGDAAHDTERDEFVFSVDAATEVAVSAVPLTPRAGEELGIERFEVGDPAAYARNLSRYEFEAAFHDGDRFYAGNGPRLLIWEDGIPDDPTRPPDVVLGRPDLATDHAFTSASNFAGTVGGIWSDGTRLAVAEGNRVLIWNQVPGAHFAPADLVLGQFDFTSNEANRGGEPGPNTLYGPDEIWSDGTRMIVADALNNRFLVWEEFPVVNNQPADLVVGQEDFVGNERNDGALPVYRARGVYHDGARTAFASTFSCNCMPVLDGFPDRQNPAADYEVGDPGGGARVSETLYHHPGAISRFDDGVVLRNGYRASVWRGFPGSEVDVADFTLGRPDEVLGAPFGRTTAATFDETSPTGHVWADDRQIVVADGRRLLVWDVLPSTDFAQADRVIGQPGPSTNDPAIDYRGISRETLAYPGGVSSAGDVTAVADRANDRVLLLHGDPANPDDVVVVGQPDGRTFGPNAGWRSPSAATMRGPAGVFTDGTRLIVADSGNHRVLIWNQLPVNDGAAADVVLGQDDPMSTEQNRGRADGDADGDIDADASTMHFPSGVAYDGRLLVADTYNHRVLVWGELPTIDTPADAVLGQPDAESNDPNRGLGWYERSGRSMARPVDVDSLADGRVVVSDSENNRLLLFDVTAGDPAAAAVLGQTDLTTDASPNWQTDFNIGWPTNSTVRFALSTTLRRPMGLAIDGDDLWVADGGNHRVLRYEPPFDTGAAAAAVVGQASFDGREPNADGLGPASVSGPEGVAVSTAGSLIVADTRNHRLLVDPGDESSGLFGQSVFERNGINGNSPAFEKLEGPTSVAVTKSTVWVADRDHHRVVGFQNGELVRVVGQPDRGSNLPNAGRPSPGGGSLARPTDVWTDGNRMVVADRDNHRVLIWNSIPTDPLQPADVVVGQATPDTGEPNGGRGSSAAAADTMLAPEGVEVVGDRLFVADTGNSRVLVFDEIPSEHGAAADRVLCQPGATDNRPNRGASTPAAGSCSGPVDVMVTGEQLFVADTLNHRVLVFRGDAPTGSRAERVLGQPNFSSRQPFDDDGAPTPAIFANPTRMAFDGTNFYVVDRGHHRILIYDGIPTRDFAAADRLLGQVDFDVSVVTPATDGLDSPSGIAVLVEPFRASTVWVADTGKDRVVQFDRVARPF